MRSLASAAGMKSLGWQRPRPGRSQRTSASTQTSLPLGASMTGWYCRNSPPPLSSGVKVVLDLRARDELLLQRLVADLHA